MLRNNIGLSYLHHILFIQLLTCNFTAGLQKATVAYPLCTVSQNSKTLQVCVSLRCMCVKHITAKKRSKHTLTIPHRQFEDKCQLPNNSKGATE